MYFNECLRITNAVWYSFDLFSKNLSIYIRKRPQRDTQRGERNLIEQRLHKKVYFSWLGQRSFILFMYASTSFCHFLLLILAIGKVLNLSKPTFFEGWCYFSNKNVKDSSWVDSNGKITKIRLRLLYFSVVFNFIWFIWGQLLYYCQNYIMGKISK